MWKNHSCGRKPLLQVGQHRPVANLHDTQNIRPNALEHRKQSRNLRLWLWGILYAPNVDDTRHRQVILKIVVGNYKFLGGERLKEKK